MAESIPENAWFTGGQETTRVLRVEGRVRAALPNAVFKVELVKGQHVLAHVAPELRMTSVRVLPGDKVTVEVTPFDLSRGRIVGHDG